MKPACRYFAFSVAVAMPISGLRPEQDTVPHVYVVQAVGDWIAVKEGRLVPLTPLTRVPADARVRVRAYASVDTAYSLTLRDPRSLRTATWTCKPVARCRSERRTSELTFAGSPIPASPRTSALFVKLGDGAEARRRVKLVGARGSGQDWGLIVFVADSGWLDTAPLAQLLGSDRKGAVLRLCDVPSHTQAGNRACPDAPEVGEEDCALDATARCRVPNSYQGTIAATIEVLIRRGTSLPNPPVGTAVAIITSRERRAQVANLTSEYWRDLLAIREHVTDAEFRALTLTAALEIARPRS